MQHLRQRHARPLAQQHRGRVQHAGHRPHPATTGARRTATSAAGSTSAWSSSQLRNFNANINFNASSAPPYTIRTGLDTNGDLLFTDRPDGVGRNTLRAAGQWTINGFFTYGWQFGKPVERAGGINFRSDGGGAGGVAGRGASAGRYRLSFNVNVQNLTNHGNLTGYSGTLTSDKFRKADHVVGTRKVDIGLGLSF